MSPRLMGNGVAVSAKVRRGAAAGLVALVARLVRMIWLRGLYIYCYDHHRCIAAPLPHQHAAVSCGSGGGHYDERCFQRQVSGGDGYGRGPAGTIRSRRRQALLDRRVATSAVVTGGTPVPEQEIDPDVGGYQI